MSTRENTVTTVVGVGEVDSLKAQLAAQAAVIEAARRVNDVWHGFDATAQFEAWRAMNVALSALDGAPR